MLKRDKIYTVGIDSQVILRLDKMNEDLVSFPLFQAKQLFLRGVELERVGKLYEAVQHYKRAVALMPDVERRLWSSELRPDTPEGTKCDGTSMGLQYSIRESWQALGRSAALQTRCSTAA